jgi:branched-chain amino acid aminotransferase
MTSSREAMGENRGLLYGDGLFETVRVEGGVPRFIEAHIARFSRSAEALGFPEDLVEEAIARVRAPEVAEGLWRVTAIRPGEGIFGGGQGGVFTRARPLPQALNALSVTILAGTYWPGDALAEHKSTSWLRSVEARRRAEREGFDDAILATADGRIGEATASNIFLRIEGAWTTPVARGLLPGVIRAVILERSRRAGVPIAEAVLTAAHLRRADAVALTSVGGPVRAIRAIDQMEFDVEPCAELGRLLDER